MEHSQKDMDAIIRKLGEHGYDGLTKEEKELLFQQQLRDAHATRYDTKLELFLTFIVLLELVLHGLQRIVLAAELPLYMKLGSVSQHKGLNIAIGLFAVLFFGLLFILALKDYSGKKIYFIRPGRDKKSQLKYLGKISFIVIIILWITTRIISAWPAFISKFF